MLSNAHYLHDTPSTDKTISDKNVRALLSKMKGLKPGKINNQNFGSLARRSKTASAILNFSGLRIFILSQKC